MTVPSFAEVQLFVQTTGQYARFDYSIFEPQLLKSRLRKIMHTRQISSNSLFLERIQHDRSFRSEIIDHVCVECTEMFRDPAMWQKLKTRVIPELNRMNPEGIKVLLPFTVSGEELYSLMIVADELNVLKRMSVTIAGFSNRWLKTASSGVLPDAKFNLSRSNYQDYSKGGDLLSYFRKEDQQYRLKSGLMKNINCKLQANSSDPFPGTSNLVILRNQLLYLKPSCREKALADMTRYLSPGGYLVLGIRESVTGTAVETSYETSDRLERIYRKK